MAKGYQSKEMKGGYHCLKHYLRRNIGIQIHNV